jgi:hypothetical protein
MAVKYVKDFSFPAAGGFHSDSVQRYAKGGHVTKMPAKAKASAKGMPARAKPNAPAKGAPKMESKPSRGKCQGYERGGPVAEITPSDGMSPLQEMAYALPYDPMKDVVVERELPMPPLDYERMDDAHTRMTEMNRQLAKLLAEQQKSEQGGGMRLSGMAPEVNAPLQLEPLERTLARDAAMAERGAMRRDMMGRPGMRGMARRTPSRMKVPSPIRQPAMTPFDLEEAPYMPVFKKGGAVKGKKIAKVMREYKKGELHSGSKKGPKVTNPKQAMAIALSESRRMKKSDGGEVFSDENLAYGNKKGPYRGSPKKGRELGRRDRMQRARDQRALDKARHAEKYAPGLSLDMPDEPMSRYEKGGSVKKAVHKHEKTMHPGKPLTKLSRGGVPSYGRKPMYGGGKC